MAKAKKEKWIQEAIKHPGTLTTTAKKANAVTDKGTIDTAWLEEQANKKGKTGQRARLAMTLKALNKGGKKKKK